LGLSTTAEAAEEAFAEAAVSTVAAEEAVALEGKAGNISGVKTTVFVVGLAFLGTYAAVAAALSFGALLKLGATVATVDI